MYSNSNSNSKELTTKYTNVDIDRLSFSELIEGKNSKGQKNAYPKYNHPTAGSDSPLFIQFPWLTMSTYGIPKIGEFIKTDADRLYIKCPLDLNISENKDLYDNLIVKLDDYFSSDKLKNLLFGKKANKYDYNQLFKLPKVDDDDDKPKSKYPKPPFLKLKLDVSYPDNKIKTIVYKTLSNGGREKINDIETINDLEKIICWKCRFKPIVKLSKIWAQTVGSGKYGPGYGATFTIIKVEVDIHQDSNISGIVNKYLNEDTFLDDDSDNNTLSNIINKEDDVKDNVKDNVKDDVKKKSAIIMSDSDDSDADDSDADDSDDNLSVKKQIQVDKDDDDNEDSDESETPIITTKSKPSVKPKSKVKKPSDEESEEEMKPAKNVKNAKPKK